MPRRKTLPGQVRFDWDKETWEKNEAREMKLPDTIESSFGDIYSIGDHRLMCGDSSNMEMVQYLINTSYVDMVFTDPPYGVDNKPRSNAGIFSGAGGYATADQKEKHDKNMKEQITAKDRVLEGDALSKEEYEKLLTKWFLVISRYLRPGGVFYIWGGYQNFVNYPTTLEKLELYFSQSIIWVKKHPFINRKDFMGDHECCFYGWREGGPHKFYGKKNISDVWVVKKLPPNARVHLTEKPIELATRAITCSSKKGDVVLDLFGGSGSTIVACEVTGRRCFCMEIDPWYCDVIKARLEKHELKSNTIESCL